MTTKTYKQLVDDLSACQQAMFDRYDIDGSVRAPTTAPHRDSIGWQHAGARRLEVRRISWRFVPKFES